MSSFSQWKKIPQISKELYLEIQREGCNFRSLLGLAETWTQKLLTISKINDIYTLACDFLYITADCNVLKPDQLLTLGLAFLDEANIFGVQIGKIENGVKTYWEWVQNKRIDGTIICYEAVKTPEHYCEGDMNGRKVFDPAPGTQVIKEKMVLLYQKGEYK